LTTIGFLLSIAIMLDREIEQMYVKTIFMYGDLEEVIYITQPKQYVGNGQESSDVCKLTKSLYDLK